MKKAHVDMTLEGLSTLLHLYGKEPLVQSVEVKEDGIIRLHLSGDELPDTYTEEPRRLWVFYEGKSFPMKGLKVTLVDRPNGGEGDLHDHTYGGGPQTDSFSVIHEGIINED